MTSRVQDLDTPNSCLCPCASHGPQPHPTHIHVRRAEKLLDDATEAVDPNTRSVAALGDLSKAQLYERAQDRDIDGRASMNKDELIAALRR